MRPSTPLALTLASSARDMDMVDLGTIPGPESGVLAAALTSAGVGERAAAPVSAGGRISILLQSLSSSSSSLSALLLLLPLCSKEMDARQTGLRPGAVEDV